MAEQSAKHFTRFSGKYCLKSRQEQQEDTSTDDVSYSACIWRPEQTLSPQLANKDVLLSIYYYELNIDRGKHV